MVPITHYRKHGVVQYLSYPAPDHHVVTTTIDGARIGMCPVDDYQHAIKRALQLADMKRDKPAVVKVQCWHIRDLCCSLGIDPRSLRITVDEVIATCKEALRDSQDAWARRDAYDLLVKLGVF